MFERIVAAIVVGGPLRIAVPEFAITYVVEVSFGAKDCDGQAVISFLVTFPPLPLGFDPFQFERRPQPILQRTAMREVVDLQSGLELHPNRSIKNDDAASATAQNRLMPRLQATEFDAVIPVPCSRMRCFIPHQFDPLLSLKTLDLRPVTDRPFLAFE